MQKHVFTQIHSERKKNAHCFPTDTYDEKEKCTNNIKRKKNVHSLHKDPYQERIMHNTVFTQIHIVKENVHFFHIVPTERKKNVLHN